MATGTVGILGRGGGEGEGGRGAGGGREGEKAKNDRGEDDDDGCAGAVEEDEVRCGWDGGVWGGAQQDEAGDEAAEGGEGRCEEGLMDGAGAGDGVDAVCGCACAFRFPIFFVFLSTFALLCLGGMPV